jgi:S-adenosylmethionine:tRNA ribosyltransferase-isomerase
MDVSLFRYDLPVELIAQTPAERRDGSRLLVVNRQDQSLVEREFKGIADYFEPGDVLVLNDTYVIPARLHGQKVPGGARIEVLLLERENGEEWEVIAYRSSRLKPGIRIVFSETFSCEVLTQPQDGKCRVRFYWDGDWDEVLKQNGEVPLPPYIQRNQTEASEFDLERYQTVFAQTNTHLNSAAAPTAGLHFTSEVLESIRKKGVQICTVTLRVGLDTFLPLRVETVEDHVMHSEAYCISDETAIILNNAKENGKRIIAGGTTSVRVLESAVDENGMIQPGLAKTNIFIYPGYKFKVVQMLLTNFHLPQSTLIMLVSAFLGDELRVKAYNYAIQNRFRFYSYGDAMLVL